MKLSLPSFSGLTPAEPSMLRYACHLSANVRKVPPLRLALLPPQPQSCGEDLAGLLGGRPVLCLAFDNMKMIVHKPLPVPLRRGVWKMTEGH
jgi:hypothetical protein